MTSAHHLSAHGVSVGYQRGNILDSLDVVIPKGEFTVIVGPNGCGKSTLLKTLSRILEPNAGKVLLADKDIARLDTKYIARMLSLMPQKPIVPEGISVYDLVSRGRYPYQSLFKQWSREDEQAVSDALKTTDLAALQHRKVASLSGGQQQRVWLAMVLAQNTDTILLDEPTSFLDISQQLLVLDFCNRLHQQGRTLVLVLHDINLALRYATHLIMMKDGNIVSEGKPQDVVTPQSIESVFDLKCRIIEDPESHTPLIIPKHHHAAA